MLFHRMENKWDEIPCTLEKGKKGKGLKEVPKVQARRRGG